MFETFNHTIDLDESISYYKDCAHLFPNHRLADDSLFILGTIYKEKKNRPEKASHYYSKVVTEYPNGDMHPLASNALKSLSKNHDIELPKIMIGNNHTNNLTEVLPVKYWSSKGYTRIVIKASSPVTYKESFTPQKGTKKARLVIDFQKSYIPPKYRSPIPVTNGLLKKIQSSQHSQSTVRVSLDIASISSFNIFSLPDPFRVVVDVKGAQQTSSKIFPVASRPIKSKSHPRNVDEQVIILQDHKKHRVLSKASLAPAEEIESNTSQTKLSLAQQLGLGVKKIVIDPGHGGKDPGAMAHGLKEKDIVLRVAKKLKPLLEKETGCQVVITRKDDRYISLEERTAIANTNDADLFISLHINAHHLSKVHGLETYFLSLSTNAEAMRVAARENSISERQLSDLQDILSDLLNNSNIDESSQLAQYVHNSILSGLERNDFHNIKNLGVKQAPFTVLIGAEMPAILIEIAFISNPIDAKNLKKDAFLNSVASDIANGIQGYINSNRASL